MQNLVNDTPRAKKNYDFVDSIRGLAMMSIVADHTFNVGDYIFKSYNASFWTYVFNIQIAKFGTVCFFLLAGFLLGDKFMQYSSSQYLRRRFDSTFKPWIIWSLIFLSGLLIRDGLNYIHFGSGGFDFWGFLQQEASITYLHSNYWFIINFLICIAILLLFKKNLYSWKLGGVLLVCTLFYSINVYFEWITPVHTTALFGFVFFLWLGAQLNKKWAVAEQRIKSIPGIYFIIVFLLCLALSVAETRLLFNLKSQDPFNTLRFSNLLYSMASFFLLVRFLNYNFMRAFKPRDTTFGIYLIHAIIVFLVLPEILIHFDLPRPGNMSAGQLLTFNLSRFATAYILTFVLVALINKSRIRWIIGSSPNVPKQA